MTKTENVREFVAGRFDCSVLYFFGNQVIEVSEHQPVLRDLIGKIWVMPRITLNADSPALLGHAKHKSPPFFGVQVSIRKHQQTLMIVQLNIRLQVLKDVASIILLHFGVFAYSRFD